MMDASELKQARARLAELDAPVTLNLSPGVDPDDKLYDVLAETLDALADAAGGKLSVQPAGADGLFPGLPTLTLGNVRYLAVPKGPELAPFLDLLVALSSGAGPRDDDLAPASVRVLIAPTCPNCPVVVGACLELAAANPQIEVEVVDVMYFADLAGPLKSVPAVVVDGTFTVVGALGKDELRGILARREDPEFMVEALESMIAVGRYSDVLQRVTSDEGLALLPRLLSHGELKERMGVMLMVEEALEQDAHGLDAAVPHLLPLLEHDNASLRGDTADLLGQIGAPGAAGALQALLQDENPDVREVAQDALDMLRKPS